MEFIRNQPTWDEGADDPLPDPKYKPGAVKAGCERPAEGTRPPFDPDRIHRLATDHVLFSPGNRIITPESVSDLVESLRSVPQRVPGIVYPHPEQPGRFYAADGNRRLMACRILGIPFLAIVLDHAPTQKELRQIRLTTNNIRKAMTPDETADEIREHIAETGETQESTAQFFGLSPGHVSKLLAPHKRLLPDLRHLADNPAVKRDVLRIIATMPTEEMQRKVAERVTKLIEETGKAKRDAIQKYADELKGRKPTKEKPLVIRHDGCEVRFRKPSRDAIRAFIDRMAAALKKLRDGDDVGNLPVHFRTC